MGMMILVPVVRLVVMRGRFLPGMITVVNMFTMAGMMMIFGHFIALSLMMSI